MNGAHHPLYSIAFRVCAPTRVGALRAPARPATAERE